MKPSSEIRVRLAPSPTGWLHIGTARSALFNYLFAKNKGGTFIIRIEDTDLERSEEKYYQDILESLTWLGLSWDEGPDKGGPYAPYRQKERTDTYRPYIQQLLDEKKAYFCFCTKEELEQARKKNLEQGKPPLYNGTCRDLTPEQQKERQKKNPSPIIRFKTPETIVNFNDLIRGNIRTDTKTLGDFAIAKNLNTPLFNCAVVIDDATMKISHVIRGEDHISNTPKQILLFQALGLGIPEYAHLTLILDTDRSKLSKRKNQTSVMSYKSLGYLPEAILNFIALLGWNPKTTQEFFSLQELVQQFDLAKVNKAGAIFDIQKLDWLNGLYIKKMEPEIFVEKSLPFLKEKGLLDGNDKEKIKKILALEQSRIQKLSEVGDDVRFLFQKDIKVDRDMLAWKDMTSSQALESLQKTYSFLEKLPADKFKAVALEKELKEYVQKNNEQNGRVLWPLRVALSGQKHSAGPFEIMEILEKEESLERIKNVFEGKI